MVLCYSASNETDISNVCFSSSLLTLPSIKSSGRSNHVRWLLVHLLFSRQQPDMRQAATRTIACGSHHIPAGTRTTADFSSQPAVGETASTSTYGDRAPFGSAGGGGRTKSRSRRSARAVYPALGHTDA